MELGQRCEFVVACGYFVFVDGVVLVGLWRTSRPLHSMYFRSITTTTLHTARYGVEIKVGLHAIGDIECVRKNKRNGPDVPQGIAISKHEWKGRGLPASIRLVLPCLLVSCVWGPKLFIFASGRTIARTILVVAVKQTPSVPLSNSPVPAAALTEGLVLSRSKTQWSRSATTHRCYVVYYKSGCKPSGSRTGRRRSWVMAAAFPGQSGSRLLHQERNEAPRRRGL